VINNSNSPSTENNLMVRKCTMMQQGELTSSDNGEREENYGEE
jgi:hypothetical protein